MIPTATEIAYFLETYRTKHISNAAIRLGVTQPTLTQSLKRLEEKVKARLFFRTKQGVVPTEQGTLFYTKAHALMDFWRTVNDGVQNSKTHLQGRFRIGCHPSVGAYTIPVLLKNLNQLAPCIDINLIHDFSRKITEGIISYNVDLGFVVNPIKHPELVLKKMGGDRVTFWKRRGITRLPRRIFADIDLQQVKEVLGKTHAKSFNGWSFVQSSSLELVRTLALGSHGVGILPERVANADGADLVVYDKNLPTYEDEIYLVYRKEVLSTHAGKALVQSASFRL